VPQVKSNGAKLKGKKSLTSSTNQLLVQKKKIRVTSSVKLCYSEETKLLCTLWCLLNVCKSWKQT